MLGLVSRYTHWLHTRWPAGTVEKLPNVAEDGTTNVAGLTVVGDLTGVPLLKFAADSGAKAVHRLLNDATFRHRKTDAIGDGSTADTPLDLVIVGASVSGMAAALAAKRAGLNFAIYEAAEPFSTIVNFPRGKPIFTYPTGMTPAGDLQFSEQANVKETLVAELKAQTLDQGIAPTPARVDYVKRDGRLMQVILAGQPAVWAHHVIVGIGRSGNFRKLGVKGEELDKVYNRLHDPKDYCGQNCLVVGGGDSALETAIALANCGANVTLSYRKTEFSRPKPENMDRLEMLKRDPKAQVSIENPSSERVTTSTGAFMDHAHEPGSVSLMLRSQVREIRANDVDVRDLNGHIQTIPNDAVFSMIGREPPLDFFRRSGVTIRGERTARWWTTLIAFFIFVTWVYHWKGQKPFLGIHGWYLPSWLSPEPAKLFQWLGSLSSALHAHLYEYSTGLLYTVRESASGPSFWYTLAYTALIVVFGIKRIRYRKTPYVTWQTLTLMSIQIVPLFLLPEILLPWAGHNGWWDDGAGKWLADTFFPNGAYWHMYGLILAWPLFIFNWFTAEPLWGWLVVGSLQTFVLIPAMIYFWGKGAYCGWICSCGAMAETLGDQHRHKMWHGPLSNRFNMIGQVILAICFLLMGLRIAGWIADAIIGEQSGLSRTFNFLVFINGAGPASYQWFVDLLLAGIVGYGLYFWFSGRVWCRFMCPLAALMHIYSRFSRFRILADKKKCISCNVCTSVCHQGIDIMNFANKGLPMADPQCVRCSACVQSCPTGVLSFGQVDRKTGNVIGKDPAWLGASPVNLVELKFKGKVVQSAKQPAGV